MWHLYAGIKAVRFTREVSKRLALRPGVPAIYNAPPGPTSSGPAAVGQAAPVVPAPFAAAPERTVLGTPALGPAAQDAVGQEAAPAMQRLRIRGQSKAWVAPAEGRAISKSLMESYCSKAQLELDRRERELSPGSKAVAVAKAAAAAAASSAAAAAAMGAKTVHSLRPSGRAPKLAVKGHVVAKHGAAVHGAAVHLPVASQAAKHSQALRRRKAAQPILSVVQ